MAFSLCLNEVELTNFHKFERYSVDFDERLTVLVGDNGSGKSSVLAAVSVALGAFLFGLNYGAQRHLAPSDARICTFDLNGQLDRQSQYPVSISANATVGEQGERISWTRALKSADGQMEDGDYSVPNLSNDLNRRVQDGDQNLVLPVIACYGTGRLWAKSSRRGTASRRRLFSRQNGYDSALDAHADEEQMLSWFFKMTAQDVQRSQSIKPLAESALFAAVRRAVEECFKLLTGSSKVRVTYNFDTDDLDIEYLDKDDNVQQMSMGLLSDGYRTTLSTFADIAYRMAVLNPMLGERVLETPGVVMIDEVDLHLHPRWQARILGDLRAIFPNVQFIVTTHAPVVISSVRAENIRLLVEGEQAQRLSGEIYGSDAVRVLTSVMGAQERPADVQKRIDEFYRLLDESDFDSAKAALDELREMVGDDDTAFVEASTALSLEEAEARYASN